MNTNTAQAMQMIDATREESAISGPTRFENVLVGVDGTSTGRDAIALADRLRAEGGGLTLAHVVLSQEPSYSNFHSTPAWKKAREMLEREADVAGMSAQLAGMFAPSVGHGLHRLAGDCDADLIVVGSCSRGLIGRVLVSDDARCTVGGAPCPVAIAPHGYADHDRGIRIIGVAYNDTFEAAAALAVARDLAVRGRAPVRALTVVRPLPPGVGHWDEPDAIRALEKAVGDRLDSLEGVKGRVAAGVPAKELTAFGDEVDLLVVGSRGHGPLGRLILGSTSMQLTRETRCPLLIVPRPAVAEEDRDTN
jgi:nucleotide-binding universal stress UspA family protein